jgi:arginase
MIRENGLHDALGALEWGLRDLGDLDLAPACADGPDYDSTICEASGGDMVRPFAVGNASRILSKAMEVEASANRFPLMLGGDHSLAMGSITGILSARPDTGVLFVDAHADINVPATSPSGNMHGMCLGLTIADSFTNHSSPECPTHWNKVRGLEWLASAPKLASRSLCYVGLRDIDEGERELASFLRQVDFYSNVNRFSTDVAACSFLFI